ncbi:MAG: dephospho-CoA kinase [Chitinophagales bacterium]|nr:dephospho-CoA kinase [Chitinophagales bacterium]MDW8427080.1 dephospho-CoA kinase [Chitinophagales bacterium]
MTVPLHGGLTGNLGAGKSTVSRLFATLGIAIYDADRKAKQLLGLDQVKEALRQRFGLLVFKKQQVDHAALAALVFSNPEHQHWLNALIHPLVKSDYLVWRSKQHGPYTLLEAALVFESAMDKLLDFVVVVTAPEPLRLRRVQQQHRGWPADQFQLRQQYQWPESALVQRAKYRIVNDECQALIPQVLQLHHSLCTSGYKGGPD